MSNNSYKEFSQIYDLLMVDIDYEKWTIFIINKLDSGKKILEAACGTGNITSLLAEKDYKITAFDLSEDMLMRAYEKLERNSGVKLLNQSMTEFHIDDKFDAVICCCDGINYLNKEEISVFFKKAWEHLNKNGVFIFDISTEYKYKNILNDTYVYDDGEIFYVWENELNEYNNTIHMEINFFIKAEDKYERIIEEQTQYMHKNYETMQMLENAGFSDIEVYDDYNMEAVKDSSLRAVFCSRKE